MLHLIDNFMAKCASGFLSLFHILGHNNARQREKLGQLLPDFAVLQDEVKLYRVEIII